MKIEGNIVEMTSFVLSPEQKQVKNEARLFAQNVLSEAATVYSRLDTQAERFHSIRPFYRKAVAAGQIHAQIPAAIGGTSKNLIDVALALEEQYPVDPSVSLTIAATGLGLTPLILGGNPVLYKKFLSPFLTGEGEPLASLVHSEPGGTANWLEKGGKGLQTAAYCQDDGTWIINGEKLWTTNSAGWDGKGADLQCVVCRYCTNDELLPTDTPASAVVVLLVTRETIAQNDDSAYQVLAEPELAGHPAVSGPHTRFTNFKVPGENLLAAPGVGATLIENSFGMSAALVGAMSAGIMQTVFEKALKFSKTDTRGGTVPIVQRQSVADLLIDLKIKLDASRLLTYRALDYVQNESVDAKTALEACLQAKIYGSDNAVDCTTAAMKIIGITSYAQDKGFGKILNDAVCLSLFDGGNVGVRRRQLQQLLEHDDYESRIGF
ncbi:acyl-CoA dehydrogenase, putative [Talaromyces stipitatus ATCC 10500]|uniref:Acyl-CoA dehydrogenase, putative n=1 Tax=Talaromyces stipitatus (strain ATCC 10500 / CBS 375.48 / QM 6759 / NRRL 1006) TaxID=441959 RepID=B8LT67_TALSN|nr:acyl-CoA dehydrogenase, putative [Talaromyces stipitatus ATCC 10500]EED23575.1 acyl-CoA dehydrogenase, putative [Talaromyces stipitatus ATCC 10500]